MNTPRPFALQHVRLLPGPFHQAQQAHGWRLLAVPPDELLHPVRQRAGLAARPRRAAALHGERWTLEAYLSACNAMWAATGNPAFRQRVLHLMAVLQQCLPAGVPAPEMLQESSSADDPARVGEQIYAHADQSLYIERYVASVLQWPEMGLRIRQLGTVVGAAGSARILVQAAERTRLTLPLRHPAGSAQASVLLNGRLHSVSREPGGCVAIERNWRQGDEIRVELRAAARLAA